MCGIAGWVDYERDLTRERAIALAMTAANACRGPDAEGLWIDRHVAIGHRRVPVIDPDGGIQPMCASEDGTTIAVITFNGEIYNFRQLRAELAGYGHRFATRSDTEVLLRAYLQWGARCGEHLSGVFAFGIWDPRDQELILLRDRLGQKPLLYYPLPHGVLFGSEHKVLFANPLVEPVVDADGLREALSQVGTPGHAVYQGMREVKPGHFLRVRREGISEHCWWRLTPRHHGEDLPATVGHVRGLLEEVIDDELVADVPLCTMLSGGLDSSTVTALAARALAAQGNGPLRTFTVNFAGYDENFDADAVRATPDAPYVAQMVEHVKSEHAEILLDSRGLMDELARAAVLRAKDLPTYFGDRNTSTYLLYRAIREHATVALSGELADELFGGFVWDHDPELVHADNFPWIAMAERYGGAPSGFGTELLHRDLLKQLDIPGYRAQRYAEAVAETPGLPDENGHDRRRREIFYLHLTRWLRSLLDHSDRLSMAVGLVVRAPFSDYRLVEYLFNVPWSMKSHDGREKSLLRAVAADLLPAAVLDRPKSPYPVTQDAEYARALLAEYAALLGDRNAPIVPFLDLDASRAVLEHPENLSGGGRGWPNRTHVEMAIQLNSWIRNYRVRLAL
jgi:asparagine synthase (glutamine-hydrolysing)